ncbi:hypothetical protein HDU96_002994 [Phlyctochytrium bullatum]|nr:hypothetical protein HDU96_002994 [Phlyctochytrium bullatum]
MPWRRQQKQHPADQHNPVALVNKAQQETLHVKRLMGETENMDSLRLAIQAMTEIAEKRIATAACGKTAKVQ